VEKFRERRESLRRQGLSRGIFVENFRDEEGKGFVTGHDVHVTEIA